MSYSFLFLTKEGKVPKKQNYETTLVYFSTYKLQIGDSSLKRVSESIKSKEI
jgi:hypothetical protein